MQHEFLVIIRGKDVLVFSHLFFYLRKLVAWTRYLLGSGWCLCYLSGTCNTTRCSNMPFHPYLKALSCPFFRDIARDSVWWLNYRRWLPFLFFFSLSIQIKYTSVPFIFAFSISIPFLLIFFISSLFLL